LGGGFYTGGRFPPPPPGGGGFCVLFSPPPPPDGAHQNMCFFFEPKKNPRRLFRDWVFPVVATIPCTSGPTLATENGWTTGPSPFRAFAGVVRPPAPTGGWRPPNPQLTCSGQTGTAQSPRDKCGVGHPTGAPLFVCPRTGVFFLFFFGFHPCKAHKIQVQCGGRHNPKAQNGV